MTRVDLIYRKASFYKLAFVVCGSFLIIGRSVDNIPTEFSRNRKVLSCLYSNFLAPHLTAFAFFPILSFPGSCANVL